MSAVHHIPDSRSNGRQVLPDSRAREGRGAVPTCTPMGWMVPIYCANCGVEGGLVPEENTTFAFWLCNPCFGAYGEIAGTMAMPDEVFWERLKQEQLEKYRRMLTPEELQDVAVANTTPLAALIREGR